MIKKPKVGIVILNWNNYRDTRECLISIQAQDYKNFELVLIDGGSTDKSTDKLKSEFTKYDYIYLEKDKGYSGSVNAGLKYFQNKKIKWVLVVNNDVVLQQNSLTKLIEETPTNNLIGIIGPRIYSYKDKYLFQVSGSIINILQSKPISKWVIEKNTKSKNLAPYIVDKLPGACLLINMNILNDVGLINEDYFLYYSDTEWQKRISNQGWLQFCIPNSKVYHKISATTGLGSFKSLYYDSRDFLYFVKEHYHFLIFIYSLVNSYFRKLLSLVIRDKTPIKSFWYVTLGYYHFIIGKRGKVL